MLEKIRKFSLFLTEYGRDAVVYFRYCGISPFQDANRRLFYKIIIECHALEKGLSLGEPRPLFGRAKIQFLMKALGRYDLALSTLPAEMVCGTFREYIALHARLGTSDPLLDDIEAFTSRFEQEHGITPDGGLRAVSNTDLSSNKAGTEFLLSRYSARIFDPALLSVRQIEDIVRVAQAAPSQCNRQASRAYFYQGREDIDRLLRLQGGSTGFSHTVNNLFIITSDLAAWGGAQQRNQPYVDGALFAMNVMLACHAHDIACCPLNLAITHSTENAIRKAGGIAADERLIMMIAVGKRPSRETGKAARSPRRALQEVLTIRTGAA